MTTAISADLVVDHHAFGVYGVPSSITRDFPATFQWHEAPEVAEGHMVLIKVETEDYGVVRVDLAVGDPIPAPADNEPDSSWWEGEASFDDSEVSIWGGMVDSPQELNEIHLPHGAGRYNIRVSQYGYHGNERVEISIWRPTP